MTETNTPEFVGMVAQAENVIRENVESRAAKLRANRVSVAYSALSKRDLQGVQDCLNNDDFKIRNLNNKQLEFIKSLALLGHYAVGSGR